MWKSWIPNSISLGNLSFGFIAILISSSIPIRENIEDLSTICGLLILIAALLDGFDGFTARLLKVESPLGEYLDSLADLTTFGLAPGFIVYQLYLRELKLEAFWYMPIGMLIASIYPLCVAYRLARFNAHYDKKVFTGLPSPISAALIVLTIVLVRPKLELTFVIGILLFLSVLMVSNVKYPKPQSTMQENFNLIRLSIFMVIILSLVIVVGWHWAALSVLVLYTFSGLLSMLFHLIQKVTNKPSV